MYNEEIKSLDDEQWEFFAQDVLYHLGFNVLQGPSQGRDDGADLIVEREGKRFLVSCKHYLNNGEKGRNVGVREEVDISDRLVQHRCQGFISFYSTGLTSSLDKKLRALETSDIDIIRICNNEIMDIIPGMMGFVLQKYFDRPQDLHHHINCEAEYKALTCMADGCGKDILAMENISTSMASLVKSDGFLHLVYGCKACVNNLPDIYWAEISQIRYIEQLMGWRQIIDEILSDDIMPNADFYQCWASLQEGILQILAPPGWGRWLS